MLQSFTPNRQSHENTFYNNEQNQMITELYKLGLEPLLNNLLYGNAMLHNYNLYSVDTNPKVFYDHPTVHFIGFGHSHLNVHYLHVV